MERRKIKLRPWCVMFHLQTKYEVWIIAPLTAFICFEGFTPPSASLSSSSSSCSSHPSTLSDSIFEGVSHQSLFPVSGFRTTLFGHNYWSRHEIRTRGPSELIIFCFAQSKQCQASWLCLAPNLAFSVSQTLHCRGEKKLVASSLTSVYGLVFPLCSALDKQWGGRRNRSWLLIADP